MSLTRAEIARGRELLREAFAGPWRYREFEIECGACRAHEEGTEGDGVPACSNPECSSNMGDGEVPCVFVEAPSEYPGESAKYSAQVVATIDVPGLSCLAQKNGEAICWLRNHAEALLSAHEQLAEFQEVLEWLHRSQDTATILCVPDAVTNTIAYAKKLGWVKP